jgi:3-deoxy-7-phosphoheptulonate synthase
MLKTDNVNVKGIEALLTPNSLKEEYPAGADVLERVNRYRNDIYNIINHHDPRFMVITGPCSIHDEHMAYEYAQRLAKLREEVGDKVMIVMRVYFEKPRTTVGWKGLINDPDLNGTLNIAKGLAKAREILISIAEIDLPIATEFLDTISPQYYSDLVSWVAIGARTTESQTHREMASGVSAPVGYKNGTRGNLDVAFNAMESARHPHSFIGIDGDGRVGTVHTLGNQGGHLVLRGGSDGPNYDAKSITKAEAGLQKAGAHDAIIVDCSHANSYKDHTRQGEVLRDVLAQKQAGNSSIIGLMLESNLAEGNQKVGDDIKALKYGVSITDACIDWDHTEALIRELAAGLPEL